MDWVPNWFRRKKSTLRRIEDKVDLVLQKLRIEMAEIDDLEAGESKIEADLAANKALLTTIRDELTAALANPGGVDSARVQAVIDKLNAADAGLEADDAAGDGQPKPTT